MAEPDVAVRVVDGSLTRELRRAVLRPGWPAGSAMPGDENPAAVHVAAFAGDEAVVGCCVVLPRPYPPRPAEPGAWQLRAMATAPDRRGHGVGSRVLAFALAEVARRGGRLVWCEARSSAAGFYRAHGFTAEGAEFIQQPTGLPHYRMWRELRAPATSS